MDLPALRLSSLLAIACSGWLGCSETADVAGDTEALGSSSSTSATPGSTGTAASGSTEPSSTSTSTTSADASSSGSSTTGLDACDPGFFGPDCAGECACVNGTCDEGRKGTGACSCDDGWSGAACDECAEAFYGATCTACVCVSGSCDDGQKGSGACECDEGWTGGACDHDCSDGMLDADGTCARILEAVEDAFVCSDDLADVNMGTDERTSRAVGQQNDFTGNQIGRALFKFDISVVPSGSTVDAATVRLRQWDNFAGFPMDTRLAQAPTDWEENTVTWNNQPAPGTALGAQEIGCCGDDYDWDVGAAVASAVGNGDAEVAYQLASDDEGTIGGLRWWMREGDGMDGGRAPRMLIRYSVP